MRQLRELGWTDTNLHIDLRFAGTDVGRMQAYANELAALTPDILLVQSTPGLLAVRQATLTIPTVFVQVGDTDLVEAGITGTLARPGGNVTGFSNYEDSIGSKWLQLLKEIAPDVTRAAVILDTGLRSHLAWLHTAEAGSASLGIALSTIPVRDPSEIERAVTEFARKPNGGLIVFPHNQTALHRKLIAGLALVHHLPSVSAFRYMAESGCLIPYGIDVADLFRRSADYIDRILKGTRPSDLPIQQPIKFETTVNLKTAMAIGLTIPPTLLALADGVIE